jgi:hypothetical protein
MTIHSADRRRDQVVVGERRTGTDERIAPDDAHLQTGILCDHTVFHDSGHEQTGFERQERPIPHHRQHQLDILGYVHIVPDDAIFDDRTGIDRHVIADGGWSVDNGVRVDDAIPADLNKFGTFEDLSPFVQGLAKDPKFE